MNTFKHCLILSTNTRGLAYVNLMGKKENLLVFTGPRKLNHLLLEISLHCQNLHALIHQKCVSHGFPTTTTTCGETFPLISDKGKKDLWKQLSEKESCLSCLVSHKSRKEYLQSLFCLTQTENVNFNLLHLVLES